jgi:hypothetical protein
MLGGEERIPSPFLIFHLDGFNTRDKCFDIFNVLFNDRIRSSYYNWSHFFGAKVIPFS